MHLCQVIHLYFAGSFQLVLYPSSARARVSIVVTRQNTVRQLYHQDTKDLGRHQEKLEYKAFLVNLLLYLGVLVVISLTGKSASNKLDVRPFGPHPGLASGHAAHARAWPQMYGPRRVIQGLSALGKNVLPI